MILSEIDIFLLQTIAESALKGKEITTWDLAKKYDWGKNLDNLSVLKKTEFINGKTTVLNYRMKRMAKEGIVSIKKDNNKNHYVLDGNRIRCCKHTFIKSDGQKNAILVRDRDGKWIAFQI